MSERPLGPLSFVMEDKQLCKYRRKSLKIEHSSKFKLTSKRFDHQFASIYTARLAALKGDIIRKARAKWGLHDVLQLSQLADWDKDDVCIVVGSLFKHQELKPSVLRELTEELQLLPQPPRTNYASFKDALFLEDEALRVKLVGPNLNMEWVVTGVVCALLGNPLENGTFLVKDWCFPECPSEPKARILHEQEKILLVSGLDVANTPESLSLNLLSEWITGMIGNEDTQKDQASVSCVIIAGNSIRGTVETYNHHSYLETTEHQKAAFKNTAISTRRFDNFLGPIVGSCPVILMPGEYDPVCHTIPQQAFHPCILPHSSRFISLHGATNPWIGRINSRVIAGSSGQPIKDIMKVAGLVNETGLTWLEQTLKWRHFAPTAPDTLPGYPYFESDPFIMTECPDIYFTGNMDKYETKLLQVNGEQFVRLICIPEFSKTQTGVVVNLQDLHTWPISFGVPLKS